MKSDNKKNYEFIKSVAEVFCAERYIEDVSYDVFFEHGQFWLKIWGEYFEDVFAMADAECPVCLGEVDFCSNCGCYNGIDFELIERQEF